MKQCRLISFFAIQFFLTAISIAQIQQPEATSLLGQPLQRIQFGDEDLVRLSANLAQAQSDYKADPNNADNIIWLGRRLAYLWRYRAAISVLSDGVTKFPNNPRLYRHRGQRYITVREFDKAIADLEKAAQLIADLPDEIETDGAPNKHNIPRSTLQSNSWYHFGLAHYLKGDFEKAQTAFSACMKLSKINDDTLVAAGHWLYMTLRRLGRQQDADKILEPIRDQMEILENEDYHRLLLMYKGALSPEALMDIDAADELKLSTLGYGVGNWYWCNGQVEKALEIFEKIIATKYWAAFGYIAAETELARLKNKVEKTN